MSASVQGTDHHLGHTVGRCFLECTQKELVVLRWQEELFTCVNIGECSETTDRAESLRVKVVNNGRRMSLTMCRDVQLRDVLCLVKPLQCCPRKFGPGEAPETERCSHSPTALAQSLLYLQRRYTTRISTDALLPLLTL
jgi:hypothetical protein